MTNIIISDLNPAGFDLLSDSESYMRELSDEELNAQRGGLILDAFLVGVVAGWVGAWLGDLITSLFD